MAQAIIHRSCTKLRSAIGYEAAMMCWYFTGDLQEIMEALEVIQPVLENAERHSLWDESSREWLRLVRNAAHGISDMVDELQDTGTPFAGRMTRSLATRKKKNRMANKMKEMKQELRMLKESRRFASMLENTGVEIIRDFDSMPSRKLFQQKLPVSDVEETMMVGRDEDKQRIMAALSASDTTEGPVILPIFGLGGIGTTALARMVFNDTQFKEYTARAWVHVSPEFDLHTIGTSIISKISRKYSKNVPNGDSKLMIREYLQNLLNDSKVVIVLDDLWEEDIDELEDLKCMLSVGGKGSQVIVIVTTCNEGIARKICTVTPFKLNPLTDDMCWEIIKKTSRFEVSNEEELGQMGRQIASKCGGLPSAARVLGGMLRCKDATKWAEVMHTDIWKRWLIRNDNSEDENPLHNFKLCYKSMRPNLRLCFAYCALLPKGHNIVKDNLIQRWIALDLIEPSDTMSTTQLAKEYITGLLDLSFLQTTKSASTSGKDDKGAVLFTMHDVVHDLATYVMGDELIVLDGIMGPSYQNKYCRCALLTNFDTRPLKLSSILPSQLRALRFVGCNKMELSDDSFSFARFLRVLDLEESSMQKLPDSICQLTHLGYINLSGCSGLVTLPESFGDLVNLLCINLSRCYGLAKLPESLRNLKKLVYLDLSFWSCFEGIPVLGGLTNLQHLNLSHPCCHRAEQRQHLQSLKGVLGKLAKLQYLNLSMCLNPIFYYMSGEESIEYIGSCINGLSSLEHLDLSHNIFLFDLPESPVDLNKLHTLDLSGCVGLKKVHRWMGELDCLMLENCRDLESCHLVVRADDAGYSSNLRQLDDANGKEVETNYFLEEVKSRPEVPRIRLTEKQKLKTLKLWWTKGSQGSVEDYTLLGDLGPPPHSLQCLDLRGYKGESFPACWTFSIYCNLVEVTMEDFPMCRTLPSLGLLPNLQQVVLRRMPRLTKVDLGDLNGTNGATFGRLSEFTIDDMESLEEFNTKYRSDGDKFMSRDIDELVIQECPKLSLGPDLPRVRMLLVSDCDRVIVSSGKKGGGHGVDGSSTPVKTELVVERCNVPLGDWSLPQHLPALHSLTIKNYNLTTSSKEIIRVPSCLHSLCFSGCHHMTSLPEGLGDLKSLRELKIECCEHLNYLPDSMQHLTSLQMMHLSDCGSITALPEWIGGLTSLQKLSIDRCPAIKYLPQSIKELKQLMALHILSCPELKKWYESTDITFTHVQPKFEIEVPTRARLPPLPPPPPLPEFQPEFENATGPQDSTATWDYFFGPTPNVTIGDESHI